MAKKCEQVLQAASYVEAGGGDDFTYYAHGNDAVYLWDGGRWEKHNFLTQADDSSASAGAKGRGAASLERCLKGTNQ